MIVDYNIFVGTENGILKGINTQMKSFSNLNNIESLNKNDEIVSMCWQNDENQDEVLLLL
jgi:hypothetical protein